MYIGVISKNADVCLDLENQVQELQDQIASISSSLLYYKILDTVKIFASHQTNGGIFNMTTNGVIQLSLTEHFWCKLQEYVRIITEALDIYYEHVIEAMVNRRKIFKQYINFDRLQLTKAA